MARFSFAVGKRWCLLNGVTNACSAEHQPKHVKRGPQEQVCLLCEQEIARGAPSWRVSVYGLPVDAVCDECMAAQRNPRPPADRRSSTPGPSNSSAAIAAAEPDLAVT